MLYGLEPGFQKCFEHHGAYEMFQELELVFQTHARRSNNEIELGIDIPTIESQESNIPMTKGTTYVVMRFER